MLFVHHLIVVGECQRLYRDNGSKKPQRGLITQVASIVPGGIAAIQRRLTSTSDALANWLSAGIFAPVFRRLEGCFSASVCVRSSNSGLLVRCHPKIGWQSKRLDVPPTALLPVSCNEEASINVQKGGGEGNQPSLLPLLHFELQGLAFAA